MSVPEYPKIDTLFDRDSVTHKVKETRIRRPEFEIPSAWTVTEKVDGTNVRVSLERECLMCSGPDPISGDFFSCGAADAPHTGWRVVFYGRTADAQMPTFLLDYLQRTFTLEKMKRLWRGPGEAEYPIILYGEGYGAKIQKGGGNYRRDGDQSFRLFDVLIGGVWLSRANVIDVARQLEIKPVPPLMPGEVFGPLYTGSVWSTQEIITVVRRGFTSTVADEEGTGTQAEGVVAFTDPPLFNGRGQRLAWKLKTKDF